MPWVLAGMAGIFFLTIVFDWGAQGTVFQGSQPDQNTAGIVDGQKITWAEYQNTIEQVSAQKRQQSGKADLSEEELEQVRQDAWDQVVGRAIMKKQAEEMGIAVSDLEVRDMLLYNPPGYLRQQFTDSTGQFRQDAYWEAIRDPKNDTLVRALEDDMRQMMLLNKWQGIMTGSITVPDMEVRRRFTNEQDKATINFIKIMPSALPTEFMSKVTDAQIQKYYDEHKNRYKQEEQRKIKAVIFQLAATGRDSAVAQEGLENLRKRFAAAPLQGIDSFAKDLADELGVQAGSPQVLSPQMWGNNPAIMNAKPGDAVIGTAQAGGPQGGMGPQTMAVTKITSVTDTGATVYHARHILIKFGPQPGQENRDSAKAVVDRVFAELKGGARFEELAMKYSQDGSARSGGDLGWTAKGQFVKEFEQIGLSAPINVAQAPIASQFGYHIIEVLARTNKSITGISVPYEVKMSSRSAQIIQQQANVFKARAEEDGYDEAAKSLGLKVEDQIPPVEKDGPPILGQRKFVDDIFAADKGDVLAPLRSTQQRMIIVAQVTDVIPKGFKKLDDVKESIKAEIARKLRVESVKAKAEQVRNAVAAAGSLSAASSIDSSLRVDTATIAPGESVPTVGVEYSINNAAFTQKEGEISPALKGENGYYIVQVVSRKINDETAFKAASTDLRNTIYREKQGRFITGYLDKLKAKAKIEDFRGPQ